MLAMLAMLGGACSSTGPDTTRSDARPATSTSIPAATTGTSTAAAAAAAPGSGSAPATDAADGLGDRLFPAAGNVGIDVGEVDAGLADRIGDVIAVATGTTVLSSESVDSLTSSLRGQHGALTEAEMAIPLMAWRG